MALKKGSRVFVHGSAVIEGDVEIGDDSSVMPGAVLRSDKHPIVIGKKSNIQDNATLHADLEGGVSVGDNVTIGHGAIVHACTLKDRCVVGMGAIVMDDAVIGEGCIIGAGALVPKGKEIPPGSLVMGIPGKVVRKLSDEDAAYIDRNAEEYVGLKDEYIRG